MGCDGVGPVSGLGVGLQRDLLEEILGGKTAIDKTPRVQKRIGKFFCYLTEIN